LIPGEKKGGVGVREGNSAVSRMTLGIERMAGWHKNAAG